MKSYNVAKYYKPRWTIWSPKLVSDEVIAHKRRTRRAYKQYLRTGSMRDFDRSQRIITNWDFD